MANLFEGANKVKNGVEELDKVLDKLKLTSERLEQIEKTFSEVEKISPDLLKIKDEIQDIKKDYEELNLEKTKDIIKENVSNITNKVFINWKLWGLYIPLIVFIGTLIMALHFYMMNIRAMEENVRKMEQENKILSDRINSVYHMHLLDKKFWYDKENQKLFLKDYEWIKKEIAKEKKKNKK